MVIMIYFLFVTMFCLVCTYEGRGLDEDTNLMVLWDGKPGAKGGTGETVKLWRKISMNLLLLML